jgi:hypothetical protein
VPGGARGPFHGPGTGTVHISPVYLRGKGRDPKRFKGNESPRGDVAAAVFVHEEVFARAVLRTCDCKKKVSVLYGQTWRRDLVKHKRTHSGQLVTCNSSRIAPLGLSGEPRALDRSLVASENGARDETPGPRRAASASARRGARRPAPDAATHEPGAPAHSPRNGIQTNPNPAPREVTPHAPPKTRSQGSHLLVGVVVFPGRGIRVPSRLRLVRRGRPGSERKQPAPPETVPCLLGTSRFHHPRPHGDVRGR